MSVLRNDGGVRVNIHFVGAEIVLATLIDHSTIDVVDVESVHGTGVGKIGDLVDSSHDFLDACPRTVFLRARTLNGMSAFASGV